MKHATEPKLNVKPLYRRVLFKISGEALMGDQAYGQCQQTLGRVSDDIKQAVEMGVEVCVVVGGGNIYRGMSGAASGMERASADYMGMIATVLNALALQHTLEQKGCETRVQSAIHMMEVCEPYIRRKAVRHMEQGRVVIFAAGTGNPFFTTDTAAALRAIEMGCDAMLKGTQVDGVYDSDPKKNPNAVRYDSLSYQEVLQRDLKVMDATAIALARENKIPIIVFSIQEQGHLGRVLCGTGLHTLIKD